MLEINHDQLLSLLEKKGKMYVVLLSIRDNLESLDAELELKRIERKYENYIGFVKITLQSNILVFGRRTMILPAVWILANGIVTYSDSSPIDTNNLEGTIRTITENANYALSKDLPTQPEKIKRKLLNNRFIGWTVVIGGFLVAIIKFLNEMDKDNSSSRK